MERADGPILHKWLASAAQADKEAMYKKIDSLDKLHQAGIVHNDLHQGNIMIDKSGTAADHRFPAAPPSGESSCAASSATRRATDSLVDLVIMDLFEMGHLRTELRAQQAAARKSVQPAQQS
jgi:predicted unusual protein kinase regulating ubiquinone biosynthesis (AarF/ABC1/UbiB family)